MVEAYLFFHGRLREFFLGSSSDSDSVLYGDVPLAARLEECFQALKSALLIVAIDLDQDDDAQVIFETLNAHGEPLLPADLLRNYIFLRAARIAATGGEPPEKLYDQFWKRFDEPFWRQQVSQGRLYRPRSDLFMQQFLASRLLVDIPVKHLFVEYKFWIEKQKPFPSVRDELAAISKQGEDFQRLLAPKHDDPLALLAHFLIQFDVGTVYPLGQCGAYRRRAAGRRITVGIACTSIFGFCHACCVCSKQ